MRGECLRENLLSIAVLEGYAALVPRRARQLDMMAASTCLVILAGDDEECDHLRQALVDCGDTTHERIRAIHDQQRLRGLPPHDALIWPPATFLKWGAKLLPADEMETARRRMQDPGWQVVVALGGGGATALCIPVQIVQDCSPYAPDVGAGTVVGDDFQAEEISG
jgi:hypothetical protein